MALLSGLRNLLFGKPPEFKRLPRYEGDQKQFLDQILGNVQAPTQQGLSYLSNILSGDDRGYQDLQRQASDFFEGNLLPSLSQRYGSAAQGEGRSSAFLNELARQGRELSAQLGSQGLGMRSQALSQLTPFINLGLNPQQSIYQTQQGTGLLDLLGAGLQGYGQVPGATLGGGFGGGGLGGLARMLPMLGGLF